MRIDNSSYEVYLQSLEEWKQKMQQAQAAQVEDGSSQSDSYVSGISTEDFAMPTANYNAQGMMMDERPPMPPMPPMEGMSGIDTEDSTTTTGQEALLQQLSNTFRANADSILATLDELGLTLEDLSDEENLNKLATAMNEGAAKLGLPTVDDLDTLVSSLYQTLSENWDSYFEVKES